MKKVHGNCLISHWILLWFKFTQRISGSENLRDFQLTFRKGIRNELSNIRLGNLVNPFISISVSLFPRFLFGAAPFSSAKHIDCIVMICPSVVVVDDESEFGRIPIAQISYHHLQRKPEWNVIVCGAHWRAFFSSSEKHKKMNTLVCRTRKVTLS